MKAKRVSALVLGAALLGLALWHARPVIIWHVRMQSALEPLEHASRLHVETLKVFPPVPEAWTILEVGGLRVRAPIRADQKGSCGGCAAGCRLLLEDGKLTIFDSQPPGDFQEALAAFAPDSDDISIFRSSGANWRSLHALAGRVSVPNDLPVTFRFAARSSKGIVSPFYSLGSQRYVIYAYSPGGTPIPTLALSRVSRDVLYRVLGSLAAHGPRGDDSVRSKRS